MTKPVRNPKSASGTEAAAHLCLTQKRFYELVARGTVTKPDGAGYDLDVIRAEYLDFLRGMVKVRETASGLSAEGERARKEKELADRLALQNARTRAELVPGSVLPNVIAATAERFWVKLAPLVDLLPDELVGRPRIEIQNCLRRHCYAALADLSIDEKV